MTAKLKSNKSVRLPAHIKPTHYKLQIKPDMEAFTFVGEETISLILDKTTKSITLHSKDIEILDGSFSIGKEIFRIVKISYQDKAETATLHFKKSLPKGKGKLYLNFRGVIAEGLKGFYRSEYLHQGQTKRIATTQFESTDARRAFPCFDEPAHKAVFELSLIIPKHLTAISNTIESASTATPKGIEHDAGYKIINFAPSPKMSTYLLAYIIGEFESIETKTKHGVRIRIFTPFGKKHQAKFALDVAKRSLEFLNSYFAIPYPLPVLDLIAIPDFSSGAMENWGAVTFRETALLVDEEHTAFANKQHVAEVIAHELVHQWFGNLVTMEWWTHLWLNESFASFMAYVVVDDLFPEWNFWTRFVLHDHANALQLDSLKNTHPIEVEVHHPDQISEIFDAISYDKGASVLRMLYHYIGPIYFRDGLRYYLKKHSYKNTASVHLWEAFEKVSKQPIKKFIQPWLAKEGYPLISVAETKSGQLQVEQSRFTLAKNIKDNTIWPTPLQFELDKGQHSHIELFSTKRKLILVNKTSSFTPKYIKANPDETGFYRTLYSPSLLAKLYEPIKHKEFNVSNRFGIIRDLSALIKGGVISSSAYLEFLQAYKNEDSYIVWSELCSGMRELYIAAQNYPKLQKNLANYYRDLLTPVVKLVGWTAEHRESHARTLLRTLVLTQFGLYGDAATIKKAQQLFAARNRKSIPADLRSAVYTLTASKGDGKTFATFQKMYKEEKFQEEQRRIGRALTMFENPTLHKQALDWMFSNHVRGQDAPILLYSSLANSEFRDLGWQWVKKNWKEIQKRYSNNHLLVYIVMGLGGFASKAKAKEIQDFFKKNPAPSAQRTIKQVVEQIEITTAWIERDKTDCTNTLREL